MKACLYIKSLLSYELPRKNIEKQESKKGNEKYEQSDFK